MASAYIYLALVPTIIAIAILNSNKNAQKKYNIKKAIQSLYWGGISLAFILTSEIIQRYYICTRIINKQIPTSFFLSMCVLGVLYPVIALNRSKLNRKKDILDEKWFCFVIVAVLIVLMVFAPAFILRSRI